MSDPSLPLQAAIVAKLKGDAAVTAIASTRIYDPVPDLPTFPYISLGDMQVLPDKADCIDGTEIFVQIDAWSRSQGYPEVKRLTAAIIAALDDLPPTVSGYTAVVFELQSVNYLREADGLTRHAAITFHSRIQLA